MLLFQVYIDLNPDFFAIGMEKADALHRPVFYPGPHQLVQPVPADPRGDPENQPVGLWQAAHAFGVGHGRILGRHILPNVVHIILITFVLDFSALVLAEAVLSYIGVGIDPSMAAGAI